MLRLEEQCGWLYVQATLRLVAGSVYLVRLGAGLAGWLGMSCWGAGVASSAIVIYFVCVLVKYGGLRNATGHAWT